MIPYGKHQISSSDIDAVVDILQNKFLTQGALVPYFEQQIALKVNSKFATAVNSATSALHLSCMALGVTEGDLVWVPAISFVATANCAAYCGATVDFVDISLQDFNICTKKLAQKLEDSHKNNILPKVIIVVHMAGQSCDMKQIKYLCDFYGVKIIEDASHAIGGKYKSKYIGGCLYSDICVFSFHPVKIITTGEGGLITTNSAQIHEKVSKLRSHGIVRNERDFVITERSILHYEQHDLGYNYRLTDLQAALGLSQLEQLDNFVQRRNKIASIYDNGIKNQKVIKPVVFNHNLSSFHLYIIRTSESNKTLNNKVIKYLLDKGIGVNKHYMPIYRHKYYQERMKQHCYLENAEAYYNSCVSIPIFPGLLDSEQTLVIDTINSIA